MWWASVRASAYVGRCACVRRVLGDYYLLTPTYYGWDCGLVKMSGPFRLWHGEGTHRIIYTVTQGGKMKPPPRRHTFSEKVYLTRMIQETMTQTRTVP